MCPVCRQPLAQCVCRSARPQPVGDGVVRVSRETKGRAGKGVTLVKGLPLAPAELTASTFQTRPTCAWPSPARSRLRRGLQGS